MHFTLISVSANLDISEKTNPNFNLGINAPRHISDGSSTPTSSANFNAPAATSAPPTPPNLGSVTFGTPVCSNTFSGGGNLINTTDCLTAVNQMLDAACTSASCSIPPVSDAQSADIKQFVGTCQVLVAVGANGAIFSEAPIQAAFPPFIEECTQPGSGDTNGSPGLTSTNGDLKLVFTTSQGGGG
jgi:hypothetical protein